MLLVLNHRWTRSKIPKGGAVSFPEGGGVIVSNQRRVTPPSTQNFFSPAALVTFDSTFFMKYHHVNDILRPPQAKIFINCVMKGQNQALRMILHVTI